MPTIKRIVVAASPNCKIVDNHLVFDGIDPYHSPLNTKSPTSYPNGKNLVLSLPTNRYFLSRYLVLGKQPIVGESFSSPRIDATTTYYRKFLYYHYCSSSSGNGGFGSSASPLSLVENGKAMTVKKEVLVLDLLVESLLGRSMGSVSDPSGSSTRRSLSQPGKNIRYKTKICLYWKNRGTCYYDSKCQFAHEKEELRPIGS